MKFTVGDPVRVVDPESPFHEMTGKVSWVDGGNVVVTLRATGIGYPFAARQLAARDETPLGG